MLESAGGTFCERVEQFGVDVGEFDKGDGRDETEEFLETVYQTVTADGEQAADEEIEVHPRIDGREDACLREGEGGVGKGLGEEDPCGCLNELGAACHVREGRDGYHADYYLDEEELHRRGYYDGSDEDGGKMQEEGRARIEEDARQDGYPREGDEIDGEVKPQGKAREGDDDEDLKRKEKDG